MPDAFDFTRTKSWLPRVTSRPIETLGMEADIVMRGPTRDPVNAAWLENHADETEKEATVPPPSLDRSPFRSLAGVESTVKSFEKLSWRADEPIALGIAPMIPVAVPLVVVGVGIGASERRCCNRACCGHGAGGNGTRRSHWPASVGGVRRLPDGRALL